MKATPIIPGRAYLVTGQGIKVTLAASGSCQAIADALQILEALQC